MSAFDQVIEWAEKELLNWQGDAVRRILTKSILTPQDKTEILAMLKERHGIVDQSNPAPKPNPAIKGTLSGAPHAKTNIILKALKDIKNVNAIQDDSYIRFGEEGLTVIYGGNGTGKSGYARVLKRACGARGSTEPIQPNVFDRSRSGPASALFEIVISGSGDKPITWIDDGRKEDLLANILVFDSEEARAIVDDESNISFLPYGTHVFGILADLLKEIKDTLSKEKPIISKLEFKDIIPNTNSGKFITSLTAETSKAEFEAATNWNENENNKLTSLKTQIFEAESPDKMTKIRRLKNLLDSINKLKADISKISSVLSTENEELLKQLINDAASAEQALFIVAKQSADNEPLQGVGGNAWQALYLAAKEYSVTKAYPGKPFPVLEPESLCVFTAVPTLSE